MTPSNKSRDWLLAILYVATIYATLEVARLPLMYLRSHGVLRLTLTGIYLLIGLGVIQFLRRKTAATAPQYIAVAALAGVYVFIARWTKTPEEQIHFVEYGLVGILFLRAIMHDVKTSWKAYALALVLAGGAGWLDEILQGLSPHRHYDVRDVGLNFVSAFLGLSAHMIVMFSTPPSPRS